MSTEEKLKSLEAKAKQISNEKIRKTERLENLRKQRNEVVKQMAQENLTPQTLTQEIQNLDTQISQEIQNLETQLGETNARSDEDTF